jgi:integrase
MNETGISLFKRKNIYYIVYTDDTGTRRHKSTKCKYKAEALKVLSDLTKFTTDNRKHKQTPLSSFIKEFLAYADSNMCKSTARAYSLALRHFLRIIGDIDINKVTAKHWDTFKTARIKDRVRLRRKLQPLENATNAQAKQRMVSATTVNVALRHLKAAMGTAARWQLIEKNPFEKLPLVTIPKRTPAFLNVQDAEKLLSVITEQWLKDIVIFAINTGMRRGELLSLRWSDVDMAARVVRITNTDAFTTKSGEQRTVSLNDAALMVLGRRKHWTRHEYIFTCDHGRRLEASRVTHAFKKAVKAAGLPEGLHLHSTRHSFASLLVAGGTSLFTVSKLLGHANAKTSEIYSHLLPQHLQNEVDKINIGLSSDPQKN